MRNPRCEQMCSALLPTSDVTRQRSSLATSITARAVGLPAEGKALRPQHSPRVVFFELARFRAVGQKASLGTPQAGARPMTRPRGLRAAQAPLRRPLPSAADRSALFAGFVATSAESDFPRSCIIGFDSSPSRCGPGRTIAAGQTWDLPTSDAFLLRVMCSSTPAGWRYLAYRPRSYCVRLIPRSPLLRATHFVAPSQTPRNCCVRFVAGVAVGSRNTCYRAARYGPTRTGLSPVGLHQLSLAPSECRVKASPMARQQEKKLAAVTTGSAKSTGIPARWF
jgi:hypothetical protein